MDSRPTSRPIVDYYYAYFFPEANAFATRAPLIDSGPISRPIVDYYYA